MGASHYLRPGYFRKEKCQNLHLLLLVQCEFYAFILYIFISLYRSSTFLSHEKCQI